MTPEISTCSSVGDLSEAASSSPGICQCENQLAHWDWDGRPHPNLPEQCRRAVENADPDLMPLPKKSDIVVIDNDDDFESPMAWSYSQAKPKAPRESAPDEQHITIEGNDLADIDDRACTKRKREETSGGGICKKTKYTTSIRIKFDGAGTQSSIKISVTMGRKRISTKKGD